MGDVHEAFQASLVVTVDFKDPWAYLALGPTLTLVRDLPTSHRFVPFLISPMRAPAQPAPEADRGTLHRWRRARYYQQDLVRYAAGQKLPARHLATDALYRKASGEIAAMAVNWAHRSNPEQLPELMTRVFRGYWDEDLSLDSVAELVDVLASVGVSSEGFPGYCEATGPAELASQRDVLIDAGCFSSPNYLVEGELYLGRQHLPLIRARLAGTPMARERPAGERLGDERS